MVDHVCILRYTVIRRKYISDLVTFCPPESRADTKVSRCSR